MNKNITAFDQEKAVGYQYKRTTGKHKCRKISTMSRCTDKAIE